MTQLPDKDGRSKHDREFEELVERLSPSALRELVVIARALVSAETRQGKTRR
jgi:hypothetical protein